MPLDVISFASATQAQLTANKAVKQLPSWLELPNNWFQGCWFTGKAAAGSSAVWAAFDGDSITAGYNIAGTGYLATGWPDKLRTLILAEGYTPYADCYPWWTYASGFGGDPVNEGFSNPSGVTFAEGGLGCSLYVSSAGSENASIQTCTTSSIPGLTSASIVGFDLCYYDYAAGTWGFTIDGGKGGSPTVTGATWNGTIWQVTDTAAALFEKVTVRGLSAGSHTIAWGWASAISGVPMMWGISLYQSTTAGIGFVRSAYPSRRMVDLATPAGGHTGYAGSASSFPQDKIALWSGQNITAGTASISPTPFGFPTQPSLAFIGFGVNDTASGINVQTFRRALLQRIRSYRRGQTNANIMVIANCFPDGYYSDASTGHTGLNYPIYKAAMREVALANNCAYLDVDSLFGQSAFGAGLVTTSDLHPTAAGYTLMANTIATVV